MGIYNMEFLSTKMAVFVDEPSKISLPSTKSGVFVDGPHTKNFPPEPKGSIKYIR